MQALVRIMKPPLHLAVHSDQLDQLDQPPSRTGPLIAGQGGLEWQYISCLSWPTQTLPPCWGAGLPQALRLVFTAMPQDWEQADHEDHGVQPPWTVQLATLVDDPAQGDPPLEGAGLSQVLVAHRQLSPESDISQGAQADHADHPPSTGWSSDGHRVGS